MVAIHARLASFRKPFDPVTILLLHLYLDDEFVLDGR